MIQSQLTDASTYGVTSGGTTGGAGTTGPLQPNSNVIWPGLIGGGGIGGSGHIQITPNTSPFPYQQPAGGTGGTGVSSPSQPAITGADTWTTPHDYGPQISKLEIALGELIADVVLRRIPNNRFRQLRAKWIRRLLLDVAANGGVVGITLLETPDGEWEVVQPYVFGSSVPRFIIMSDDSDPELLLANRVEVVMYIARIFDWAPTRVIQAIEALGEPLVRLAQAAEEEQGEGHE